ncbi:MAG TPA: response regulator [Actinoallomurus sp.]|jgi:DNA-binding NarL/FixJ family response regulator
MTIRCLIVDDNDRFLAAARELLEREGIAVVGVATDCAGALQRTSELRPDVTLVDVQLGTECGTDLAHSLADASSADPHVILMSVHAERDFCDLIEACPALGFLPKTRLSGDAVRGFLASAAT